MPDLNELDIVELARNFFDKKQPINQVANNYSRQELTDYVRERCARIAAFVRPMTPEQVAYRMPGTPQDWDASGDEAQFDTSEIVTHLAAGTTFYWFGLARSLGHPRPRFTRPPSGTALTGQTGSVKGRGGWRGVPAEELVPLLNDATEGMLRYVEGLPEDLDAVSAYEGFGELTIRGWLMLLVVHYYMHEKQLEEMVAQPDFPRG